MATKTTKTKVKVAAKTKVRKFDAARFLDSEEKIAAYLNEAFEEGNEAHIRKAFGTVARARGMTTVARKVDMSRESLYRALSENGNPEFTTMLKVAKAVGVEFRIT